ncbi:non-specific lipid transfer protein GPI-anchored 1-like [Musa acuminata AAA Group]|uniref:(wild Malaysian banana) hypothetical protein n=1 Tax=Musa acuminata subsp. malaccensis TaxID=214687 RepID=A0A8D7FL11_MUSAM|nr:PREDICTED: non-specific lipid transfer protein GPI-anchored 1-like [Musa acuminata subsp. malaccensis]CAG1857637.1 unnamed protein product [Musa acuminata subsp. malaccensis]
MAGSTVSFVLSFILLFSAIGLSTCEDSSIQQKCSQEFTKVTSCMDYATAKASAPSSSCCSAVTDIRNADAVCLCYIIQQTHGGSSTIKSLGLQFDRLLQLPDACKLANTSVSNCPKLLKLSPSSPDYAIFMNATKANFSSGGSANVTPASNGFMCRVRLDGSIAITLVSAIFFSVFSIGA